MYGCVNLNRDYDYDTLLSNLLDTNVLGLSNGDKKTIKDKIYKISKKMLGGGAEQELNKYNYSDSEIILATYWGFIDVLKLLLKKGAKLSFCDNRGKDVFQILKDEHKENMIFSIKNDYPKQYQVYLDDKKNRRV